MLMLRSSDLTPFNRYMLMLQSSHVLSLQQIHVGVAIVTDASVIITQFPL